MPRSIERTGDIPPATPLGRPLRIEVVARGNLHLLPSWRRALAHERKDHRYYELVEDTLHPEFDYRYFVIRDARGEVRAVQPFFLLDQDLLVGMAPGFGRLIHAVRRLYPRFMLARTLMVGCAAGEGHLDGDATCRAATAELLAERTRHQARALGARLVVLKEFPARYRPVLECFVDHGFARIPSMPMTKVSIDYPSFEEYMTRALNSATRKKLRKKFQAAERAAPIDMSVVHDVTPHIAQIYPLYLQVYHRSKLHFEKLTEAYFCELGRRMPDKARFFSGGRTAG